MLAIEIMQGRLLELINDSPGQRLPCRLLRGMFQERFGTALDYSHTELKSLIDAMPHVSMQGRSGPSTEYLCCAENWPSGGPQTQPSADLSVTSPDQSCVGVGHSPAQTQDMDAAEKEERAQPERCSLSRLDMWIEV